MTTPTNKQLREFIIASFNESEFDLFCFDYFEGAEHLFSDGMNMLTRVVEFIRYCQRQHKMDELLKALERERPSTFPKTFTSPPSKSEQVTQTETAPNSFIHEKTGLEFVRIPAGEFLFGEKNFRIYLAEYWIGKTPVTFAAYQRFIRDNPDYPVPFKEVEKVKLYNWDERWRSYPSDKVDHPVVLVSWFDAIAFCEWADLQLPTEEQWEKSARGTEGYIYPWGNEWKENHCNSLETKIGGTSPVGKFSPQGDSTYGCVDMSGNVWEWCLNKFDSPGNSDIDHNNVRRAVRGGSFSYNHNYMRAASRNYNTPDSRSYRIGFRVILLA